MRRLQQLADGSVQLTTVTPAADWQHKAPIQRKTGKGAVVTDDTGVLHSWVHDEHVKTHSQKPVATTREVRIMDGASRFMRMMLKKGTISIFYFKKAQST